MDGKIKKSVAERKGGMKKSIITLLSDFGDKDGFAGILKGVILTINPAAEIVDLSHNVRPHNVLEGSLVLRTCYHHFPPGTIHVAVVDPGVGGERRAIAVQTQKYFFIGPDNGLLSFALENERVKKVVELTNKNYFLKVVSNTFHGRDVFAPVAAHLSLKKTLHLFGKEIREYKKFTLLTPRLHTHGVTGRVIYVDYFGNLVTNISGGMALKLAHKKLVIKIANHTIDKIYKSYSESGPGQLVAVVGSNDCLEIAVNQGNASEVLKVKEGTGVEITMM